MMIGSVGRLICEGSIAKLTIEFVQFAAKLLRGGFPFGSSDLEFTFEGVQVLAQLVDFGG